MEEEQRKKAVLQSLRTALDGLSEGDITEERVRSMLKLDHDDQGLTINQSRTVVHVDNPFGAEAFVRLGPPTWVQYHQHRVMAEDDE